MFPELCTAELAPLPNAPVNPDMRRRKIAAAASQKQETSSTGTQAQTQQLQQQRTLARTVSRWRRWALVIVVFGYLILSKLIARSTSASAGGDM